MSIELIETVVELAVTIITTLFLYKRGKRKILQRMDEKSFESVVKTGQEVLRTIKMQDEAHWHKYLYPNYLDTVRKEMDNGTQVQETGNEKLEEETEKSRSQL